jgi:hypothetical protein
MLGSHGLIFLLLDTDLGSLDLDSWCRVLIWVMSISIWMAPTLIRSVGSTFGR